MINEDEAEAAVMAAETVRETKIFTQKNGGALVTQDPRAARALAPEETCIYPGCPFSRRTRGQCHHHYQSMRSFIRDGLADEEDLIRRGLLLPEGTGGLGKIAVGHDAFKKGSTVLGRAFRSNGSKK